MNFKSEMAFTNKIHAGIAMPKFYIPNHMPNVISEVGTEADLKDGIDYVVQYDEESQVTVQERFRRSQYKIYRDVTFRYDKPSARGDIRREFFKIKAETFLYGIINEAEDDFEWAVWFRVEPVIEAIKDGRVLYQFKSNGEGDTNFIAVNITALDALDATLIKYNL